MVNKISVPATEPSYHWSRRARHRMWNWRVMGITGKRV